MFRKIHSNGESERYLFREIGEIVRPHVLGLWEKFSMGLKNKPKTAYAAMVVIIIFSLAYSFLFSSVKNAEVPQSDFKGGASAMSSVSEGLGAILSTSSQIRRNLTLRKQVDSVLNKPVLSHTDSVFLMDAIKDIQTSNKKSHENKP